MQQLIADFEVLNLINGLIDTFRYQIKGWGERRHNNKVHNCEFVSSWSLYWDLKLSILVCTIWFNIQRQKYKTINKSTWLCAKSQGILGKLGKTIWNNIKKLLQKPYVLPLNFLATAYKINSKRKFKIKFAVLEILTQLPFWQ